MKATEFLSAMAGKDTDPDWAQFVNDWHALESDNEGQLVIYTNCMWTGKNGQAIIGEMNVEGEKPEWEES